MADGRIYMLQPSFASGEISPDVASRVDLDKYQSALLQAENVFVRPYGSAYRRPGTKYMGNLQTGQVRLQEFTLDVNDSYLLVFTHYRLEIYHGAMERFTTSTPFYGDQLSKLRFAQSADVMFIASGDHPVQVLTRYDEVTWTLESFIPSPGYFDSTTMVDGVELTPSGLIGNIDIEMPIPVIGDDGIFDHGQVNNWIELTRELGSNTIPLILNTTTTSATTSSQNCGPAGWKVVSHGTWTGSFSIEYSTDNGTTWKTLRTYTSNDDYNVTESGTFDKQTLIRLTGTITSGFLRADLTRFPYTNKIPARIVRVYNPWKAEVNIKESLVNLNPITTWAFGCWDTNYGYPSCVTFFQDRLCFAANNRYPYMVWMSRTGDYYNFGTERVDGTLTDDSAVAISFISRKDYRILHLMAQADLMVMTEGNEWIVNGAEVVTPTNVSPRVQTSRGCTDVPPEMIGGQMIYVQRHGKTVRDLQYNFGTDSYDGMDLTILAKHITQDVTIVDAAYMQEPDNMMFFVLSDGTCACLTYVNEQKVYAWSRMVTDGKIKAVESVAALGYDRIFFVVQRGGINRLELLAKYPEYIYRDGVPDTSKDDPESYVMLDCADFKNASDGTITASWLANRKVDVLADGRAMKGLQANGSGKVTLDGPHDTAWVGLPYTSTWELPNIEMQLQDGTLQGRRKKVSEVILRLERSLGGRVGINTNKTDVIKYDELMEQDVTLYSGEKLVTVPNVTAGGFNDRGRVVVVSDDPYPLSISSIVRAVVPGG